MSPEIKENFSFKVSAPGNIAVGEGTGDMVVGIVVPVVFIGGSVVPAGAAPVPAGGADMQPAAKRNMMSAPRTHKETGRKRFMYQ